MSTDDYFYKNGQYTFRSEDLAKAHQLNQEKAKKVISNAMTIDY